VLEDVLAADDVDGAVSERQVRGVGPPEQGVVASACAPIEIDPDDLRAVAEPEGDPGKVPTTAQEQDADAVANNASDRSRYCSMSRGRRARTRSVYCPYPAGGVIG